MEGLNLNNLVNVGANQISQGVQFSNPGKFGGLGVYILIFHLRDLDKFQMKRLVFYLDTVYFNSIIELK